MSDFSPILVLQIKICIKTDSHGKDKQESEIIITFGGKFHVRERF